MSEIKLLGPFEEVRGAYKGSAMVFRKIHGRIFGSARPRFRDVRSEAQTVSREITSLVAKAWVALTEEQRVAWQEYTDAFLPSIVNGRLVKRRGYDVYRQVNCRLRMIGLDMVSDAPVQAPPPPIRTIEMMPFVSPDTYTFRLAHPYGVPDGHIVSVLMTPATGSPARKGLPRDLRLIAGIGPQSAMPLCASGDTVEFNNAKQGTVPGERFLVEARVIRLSDGLASSKLQAQLFR